MATFSDVDRNFDPNDSGDIRITTDEVTLDHAIRNILETSRGERYLKPTFGSRLKEALGEQMDDETRRFIRLEVQEALRQDPRVDFERINVRFSKENHSAIVEVIWSSAVTFSKKKSTVEVSLGG